MKAAQVLLLLIAFIAASHLRRDIVIKNNRVKLMQQSRQMAANTAGTPAGYAADLSGLKGEHRFLTRKKEQ